MNLGQSGHIKLLLEINTSTIVATISVIDDRVETGSCKGGAASGPSTLDAAEGFDASKVDGDPAVSTAASAPVRHAEKARKATCLLADRIATLCIHECKERLREVGIEYQQTVFAAIVMGRTEKSSQDLAADVLAEIERLCIVGCGVGTKVFESPQQGKQSCLRDGHAEALAHRAFQHFLLKQLHIAEAGRRPAGNLADDFAGDPSITEPSIFTFDESLGLYTLLPGITFHLYTSSAPCGNATIKRWAKGKRCFDCNDPETQQGARLLEESTACPFFSDSRPPASPTYMPTFSHVMLSLFSPSLTSCAQGKFSQVRLRGNGEKAGGHGG
ncbi:hypothetical protein CYMTET_26954 [Cymbomonas tetramitiformis]|uniref:tRNA-specific adenosine deaminase 1 n=1 Tax=Cymbomonas tetramitiformis TaxID=36881 RepID=A0AAE0FRB6_9CHLO|nr:hypothetical protein CYMTET_26954 [Cymbomonas tetramitiformis]